MDVHQAGIRQEEGEEEQEAQKDEAPPKHPPRRPCPGNVSLFVKLPARRTQSLLPLLVGQFPFASGTAMCQQRQHQDRPQIAPYTGRSEQRERGEPPRTWTMKVDLRNQEKT